MPEPVLPRQAGLKGDVRISGRVGHGFSLNMLRSGVSPIYSPIRSIVHRMFRRQLSPTSFAILGLLSIQPFTTYELAQQMDRTVSWFWPRAASMIYEEPKKLVAEGLATSQITFTGK